MTHEPKPTGRKPLSPDAMLEFLRTNAHRDDDCLLWAGATDCTGYPVLMWNRKAQRARNLLFALTDRHVPPRHCIYATCGSTLCMTEAHLKSCSRGELLRRMARQGRATAGMGRSLAVAMGRAKNAKLPITEARAVAQAIATGHTMAEIGRRYDVHPSRVSSAVKNWTRAGVLP